MAETNEEKNNITAGYSIPFEDGTLMITPGSHIVGDPESEEIDLIVSDRPIVTYIGDSHIISIHRNKIGAIVTNPETHENRHLCYGACPNLDDYLLAEKVLKIVVGLRGELRDIINSSQTDDEATNRLDDVVASRLYGPLIDLIDGLTIESGLFDDLETDPESIETIADEILTGDPDKVFTEKFL